MALKIKLLIDSVERQDNLLETEWVIEENAGGRLSHVTFTIDDPNANITLTRGKEVIVEDFNDATNRLFGGILTEVADSTHGLGLRFACKALDWTFLMDRALVNETYRGKSDQFVIADATDGIFKKSEMDLLTFGFVVNNTNIREGNANTQFLQFKRQTLRDIMDTLRDMVGFVWYVDSDKNLFYEEFGFQTHAFHLSDAPDDVDSFPYMDLRRVRSITKLVNAVTVEGAFLRELFADIAIKATVYSGDGATVKHNLSYLWQSSTGNTRIKVFQNNGADADPPWGTEAEKTVGLAGSDTLTSHDTLWDPAARTLEWATAPPNATNSFRIEGDRLRALIHKEVTESSVDVFGLEYGYSIKDVTLLSDEHVVLRAQAELRKLEAEAERLTLRTTKDGIRAGKSLGLVNSVRGIGSTGNPAFYLVDKVVTRLLGGQVAEYTLQLSVLPS